ncbi:MAG: DUF4147 domain-containing protein [Balneolaceae bacterium]
MDKKEQAAEFFTSVLEKINPARLMPGSINWNKDNRLLTIRNETISIGEKQDVYIIGAGKASATMAEALENILGDIISGGQIITPPGAPGRPDIINVTEGSHPVPDHKSVSASQNLLRLTKKIPESSLVLNVLSGGASSLFCIPADNLVIEDIRLVFGLLIQSGASIQEINTVRKSLSAVKGGRLLNHLRHTTLVDLIISDVPDDDISFIGSGPTIAQEISYEESVRILGKYSLRERLPQPVQQYLSSRLEQERTAGKPFITQDFESHTSHILMSAIKLAESAARQLEEAGYRVKTAAKPWTGNIEEFQEHILSEIKSAVKTDSSPEALIFFGESTVNVEGGGLGGRNQELALRMAKHLAGLDQEIVFLSAGTDGIDGPTDAAGAVVDQHTIDKALKAGIEADTYLQSNDSYNFFKKAGGHIMTGPTGNNLMDLQIVLIS